MQPTHAQDGAVVFRLASLNPQPDWAKSALPDETPVWLGAPLLTLASGDILGVEVRGAPYGPGMYMVEIQMDSVAADAFSTLTATHVGHTIALMVGRLALTAPTIRERIPGGRVSIDGMDGFEAALHVAEVIREAAGVSMLPRARLSPDQVRLDTPENTVRTYFEAMHRRDWETAVTLMHAETLNAVAEMVEDGLTFENGYVSGWSPAYDGPFPNAVPAIPLTYLLDAVPDEPSPQRLSPEDRFVLLLRIAEIQGQIPSEYERLPEVLGTILDGERAYILVRRGGQPPFSVPAATLVLTPVRGL